MRARATIAIGTSNMIPEPSISVVAKPKYSPARTWVWNASPPKSSRKLRATGSTTKNPNATPERQEYLTKRALRHDGPAGVFEVDDGENWEQSTYGTKSLVARRYPLHYAQNLGHGEVVHDETGPPHIDGGSNEFPQLWYYENWTKWMAASNWDELKSMQTPPEPIR